MARNLTPFGGRGGCCVYDTCGEVCPSGARYSPDFTFRQLIEPKKIVLHDRTLVRRLILDERGRRSSRRRAVHQDRPGEPIEYRAKTFVVASGYCWSSHLLLLSANSSVPERPGQQLRAGRPVHERAHVHQGHGEHRRSDLSRPEHDAQPDLARVLPLPDGQAVRAARHARVGELGGPRSAAAAPDGRCCSATS